MCVPALSFVGVDRHFDRIHMDYGFLGCSYLYILLPIKDCDILCLANNDHVLYLVDISCALLLDHVESLSNK